MPHGGNLSGLFPLVIPPLGSGNHFFGVFLYGFLFYVLNGKYLGIEYFLCFWGIELAWIDIPGGFFQACFPLIRDSLGGIVNAFFHRAIDGQRGLGGIFVEEQPCAHATQGYHHSSGGHLAPQGNNESFAFALGGLPFPE